MFVVAWLMILTGIASVRWELLALQMGLLLAAAGTVVVFVFGVLSSLVVVFRLMLRKPVAGRSLTFCIFGLLPAAVLLVSVGPSGFGAPAIHDITTDTETPPPFELATKSRVASDNGVEYEGEVIARLQREAYPDIEPLSFTLPADTVMAAVLETVEDMGWEVLGTRMPEDASVYGIVEAVATSAIFRFDDDVIIRVSKDGEGSRVDVRSASRVGLGDLGANAARVRSFSSELEEKI